MLDNPFDEKLGAQTPGSLAAFNADVADENVAFGERNFAAIHAMQEIFVYDRDV
jgi:hypothetical protein